MEYKYNKSDSVYFISEVLEDLSLTHNKWKSEILGTKTDYEYIIVKENGVFTLKFRAFTLFDIMPQVFFNFYIENEQSTDITIIGEIKIHPIIYGSIFFTAIIFLLMIFIGNDIDYSAVVFFIILILSSTIHILFWRNRIRIKVDNFFKDIIRSRA